MLNKLLFLDNLGGGEIMMIAFFILLFFGSDKIPGLMRSLGRAMREFRTAMDDVKSDLEKSVSEPARQLKENMEVSINEPIKSVTRNLNNAISDDEFDNSDVEVVSKPKADEATAEPKEGNQL